MDATGLPGITPALRAGTLRSPGGPALSLLRMPASPAPGVTVVQPDNALLA